jgi:hypothetical protein
MVLLYQINFLYLLSIPISTILLDFNFSVSVILTTYFNNKQHFHKNTQ